MSCETVRAETSEFARVNLELRQSVLAYGERHYDEAARLVRRVDSHYAGRLDVAQHSLTYAAALMDAGEKIERANAILSAVLDHQWLNNQSTWKYGNFIWWHDLKEPMDPNAVAFMTPWFGYLLGEHPDKVSAENKARLAKALPLCLTAVRAHQGPVHYDNIWFLKIASRVMLARALEQPGLLSEAEKCLDEWIAYFKTHGIDEYNSPCYAAVNVHALEFVWHYAPDSAETLRAKTRQLLDFFYADIFMNWHFDAGIGAGTHSRAYPRDRDTGEGSLVSFLVYKQCGGVLRGAPRPFEYNVAVNDYRVPDAIRAFAKKDKRLPLWLEATHPGWGQPNVVRRSLHQAREVSLGTQTGYRVTAEQEAPFKITYAGSKVAERASVIRPVPAFLGSRRKSPVTFAAHQAGERAIVLFDADMQGLRENAYLRLVIEPGQAGPGWNGMLDELLVNGRPYDRSRMELQSGTVLAWRVGKALTAVRLLDAWGIEAANPVKHTAVGYSITPVDGVGLCLHGLVCYRPAAPVSLNDLSCGFAVLVSSVDESGSLAALAAAAAKWDIREDWKAAVRDIAWQDGGRSLRLLWDGPKNQVAGRWTDGVQAAAFPFYASPLINLKPGDAPTVDGSGR